MSGIDSRLERCFAAVFPTLNRNLIASANIDNVVEWDSLAAINLFTAIEEEFAIRIKVEEFSEMSSFEAIRVVVLQQTDGQPARQGS